MPLNQDSRAPESKQVALDAHSSSALYNRNHSKDGARCKAHGNSLLEVQESNYEASQAWSSAASTSSAKDSEINDTQGSSNANNKRNARRQRRKTQITIKAALPLRYESKKKLRTNTTPKQPMVKTVNIQEARAVYTMPPAVHDNKETPFHTKSLAGKRKRDLNDEGKNEEEEVKS
ncbi:hypothetical protein [Parasitella parasitica]|uniref:Uncharacterized protein n=1 Tax=Parasitella parasitica TaxID=35722 RepID=A0A0B7NE74_9FUNG|nr:hypothetical protein [Parasitella parasitica]